MSNFVLNALVVFPAVVAVVSIVFAVYWRRNTRAGADNAVAKASRGQVISAVVIMSAFLSLMAGSIAVVVSNGVGIVSIIQSL